ncbi:MULTISPECIES: hypothetical protein [Burkholderia]|uniref:hypothetical protein n=1 Tax=Burkholderia TaxID=32008 RepID=UPI00103E48DE|nr:MULTISPECIES: hypothetical protein [Burkholderia]
MTTNTADRKALYLTWQRQLLLIGLTGGELSLSLPLLPLKLISIEGCYVESLNELRELVELARRSNLPPLPTYCRSLHEAEASLADHEAGRVIGRVILVPEVDEPKWAFRV